MPVYCQQFPIKKLLSISSVKGKKMDKNNWFSLWTPPPQGKKFVVEQQKMNREEKDINPP